jgi:hypothetical protein
MENQTAYNYDIEYDDSQINVTPFSNENQCFQMPCLFDEYPGVEHGYDSLNDNKDGVNSSFYL